MRIREIRELLFNKAKELSVLAENLAEDGSRKLSDRENKMVRQVQAEIMIDQLEDLVTAWEKSGDERHLEECLTVFDRNINLEV
jgi:hypothetical protein